VNTRLADRPNVTTMRRQLVDRVAAGLITLAGLSSVAVLLGIFVLLLRGAILALFGGIDAQPLTDAERAVLSAVDVASLDARAVSLPTPWRLATDPTWAPAADEAQWGLVAMMVSTAMTTLVAMVIAVPLGFAAAACIAYVLRGTVREVVKLGVELLAAIPSVVVGFIGLQVVGPWIGFFSGAPGGLSAFHGGVLLAVMSLPTIVSVSEDALRAVPRSLLEAALALGADRFQTLVRVVFPAARSGLLAAAMLGTGRAVGETMTVLMATGNTVAMPDSVFDPVRTLTATIAIELGEVPADSTHYHALFGVGLLLFLIALTINLVASVVLKTEGPR
jgi:phosphate transport system permease protein